MGILQHASRVAMLHAKRRRRVGSEKEGRRRPIAEARRRAWRDAMDKFAGTELFGDAAVLANARYALGWRRYERIWGRVALLGSVPATIVTPATSSARIDKQTQRAPSKAAAYHRTIVGRRAGCRSLAFVAPPAVVRI